MLKLDELISQREFGLDLVAGSISPTQDVAGAHVIEVANPVQWLPEDWVVLTNGLRLQDRPDEQRKLIRELTAGGLTALGFGTGVVFEKLPPALLDEAHRCDFPIVEVPYATSFRDIIRFVEGSLHDDDLHVLHRTVSMQRWLMDALSARPPERELVRRLRSLLDGTVMLFHPDGELEVGASDPADPPWEKLWSALTGGIAAEGGPDDAQRLECGSAVYGSVISDHRFEVAGKSFLAVPVFVQEEVRYWLVAELADGRTSNRIALQVIESARSVLQGIAVVHAAAARERRSVRLQLLHDLISGAPSGTAELTDRAAAVGIDFASPARLLLFELADPSTKDPQRWLERVERSLDRKLAIANVPHLTGRREGRVVLVAQSSAEIDVGELLAELAGRGLHAHCGVGRALTEVGDGPRSFADAQIAVSHARLRPGPEGEARWVRFEDLDLAEWLLGQAEADQVAARATAIVDALPSQAELRETLATFFALDLDVTKTARRMNLHPNSLRYRLSKIESVLDRRLSRPADIASLYLALAGSQLASSEPSLTHASID